MSALSLFKQLRCLPISRVRRNDCTVYSIHPITDRWVHLISQSISASWRLIAAVISKLRKYCELNAILMCVNLELYDPLCVQKLSGHPQQHFYLFNIVVEDSEPTARQNTTVRKKWARICRQHTQNKRQHNSEPSPWFNGWWGYGHNVCCSLKEFCHWMRLVVMGPVGETVRWWGRGDVVSRILYALYL